MPKPWQEAGRFNQYLEDLMTVADIPDRAELSRLSGVAQAQLSYWRAGTSRPSRESLRKIAGPLNTAPYKLWLAAGIVTPEELSVEEPNLEVTPRQIRRMDELLDELEGRDRDDFLQLIDRANEWAEARLERRRREARKTA